MTGTRSPFARLLSLTVVLGLLAGLAGCDRATRPTGPEMSRSSDSSGSEPSSGIASAEPAGETIPGRYIVVLRDAVGEVPEVASELARSTGGELGHVYRHAIEGFSITLPEQAAERAVAALENRPQVEYVEQDRTVRAFAQTVPAGVDRIEADRDATADIDGSPTGVPADVAILDTGIDLDRPGELNVEGSVNCLDATSGDPTNCVSGGGDDDHGHGTHVAGTVGAVDDGDGVVGVAPGVDLWAVKVLDSGGSGTIGGIVAGIDWIVGNGDIEVANMSLGAQGTSQSLRDAVQSAVGTGITFAVAAGNSAADVYGSDGTFGTDDDFIPAAYPEVATVSAMAEYDGTSGGSGGRQIFSGCGPVEDDTFAACFSNYSGRVVSENPVTSPGAAIDLAAPGVSVLSTSSGGGTERMSGTSMAAPHVAGALAVEIAAKGADYDASGTVDQNDTYDVRQALIDRAQAQAGWQGGDTGDPDGNPEGLVYFGATDGSTDESPSVAWTNPTDGATVGGTVGLSVDATDDNAVAQVEFFVDGSSIATDSYGSDGWTTDWNSEGVSDGDHDLTAEATDDAGQGTSTTVTVTVDNSTSSGDAAPTASIDGVSEHQSRNPHAAFDVSWSADDSDGDLASAELTLRDPGGNVEDTESIDLSGSSASGTTRLQAKHDDGTGTEYTLEVVVTDSSGNTGTATSAVTENGS